VVAAYSERNFMNTGTNLTPEQARDLLTTADVGIDRGISTAVRSRLGAGLSIGIGALVAAFFIAAVYVLPYATWQVALLVSGGYAAGILVAVTVYNRYRRVTPVGWVARYQRGLAVSMAVFFVALALFFLVGEASPWLWVPLAVAAGLPVAINGSRKVAP
jgi:hypothetical protein